MLHIPKYFLGLQVFAGKRLRHRPAKSFVASKRENTLISKKKSVGQSACFSPWLHQTRWSSSKPTLNNQSVSPEDNRMQRKPVTQLFKWSGEDYFNWASEKGFSNSDARIVQEESKHLTKFLSGTDLNWYELYDHFEAKHFTSTGDLIKLIQHLQQSYDAFTKGIVENMDANLPFPRNAPEYQYLTNSTLMREALNTFKPLPGHIFNLIKGYEVVDEFFISKNRLELWERYFEASKHPERKLRIVPSGPHGVGKSGIGLMLATTAYIMRRPLFYLPDCRNPLTKELAIKRFYRLNKDLIETDKNVARAFETLLGETFQNLNTFWEKFTVIPGAVVILDEHNEFYRQPEYTKNPAYQIYTSFQTFAAASFLMFIGSAHSKFENNIPDGYQDSLTRLAPLTLEEFTCFVNAPNNPLSKLDWQKIPGNNQDEKIATLHFSIGGIYRSVLRLSDYLADGGSFDGFRNSLVTDYFNRLNKSIAEAGDQKDIFVEILRCLQNNGTVGTQQNQFTTSVYDHGLLYVDKEGSLRPVNQTALQAIKLLALHSTNPVNGAKTNAEKGHRLEEQLLAAFKVFAYRDISGFQITLGKPKSKRHMTEATASRVCVMAVEEIPDNDEWDLSHSHVPTLAVPSQSNHRAWDAIIKCPDQLCLFQVTASRTGKELREKFDKYWNFVDAKKSNKRTHLEQYAKQLYGLEATIERNDFQFTIVVPSESGQKRIPVRFFICHGVPQEKSYSLWSSIQGTHEGWHALTIIPQETLALFDIVF